MSWMNALGHSLNRAVNGDRAAPLALPPGRQERYYRLHATVKGVRGGVVARRDLWDWLYTRAHVDCATAVLPARR